MVYHIYGHGGHLGYAILVLYIYTLVRPYIGQRRSYSNIMVIYMYTAPGWGADEPLVFNFFQNIVKLVISYKIFYSKDI